MNLSQIRRDAALRLREDGNSFRRLVLIHCAITAGLSLVIMLLLRLSQQFTPEGNLSTMDTLVLLQTGQTLLQIAQIIILPFWNAGLIFCSLELLKRNNPTPASFTEGFRRWGPLTVSMLVQGVIYLFATIGCFLASSIITSLVPMPASVLEELTVFMENPTAHPSQSVRFVMALSAIIYCATLCVLLIPKLYLYRPAAYRIMDDEGCGGLQSVVLSGTLMRGNRKKLFLLDLSFWWFYLLELGISALSMADLFLPELGISIPGGDLVCPIAALLAQFLLHAFAKPRLAVSYALFFKQLFEEGPKAPEPAPRKRAPWSY